MPPGMPTYRRYCPYTAGAPDGTYHGPDLDRARALVRASGTVGTEVQVGAFIGDPVAPYVAQVLRSLGYRVTVRRFPITWAGFEEMRDPASGLGVVPSDWVADYPAPSTFYDATSCAGSSASVLHGYCNPELDRRAAAAALMRESEPGRAQRTWTRDRP